MLYCEKCERLQRSELAACDACGSELRQPRENDSVLLVVVGPGKIIFVEPLLEDAGLPYAKQATLGAGFTMRGGNILETYRIFVPYATLAQSQELLRSALGEDGDLMAAMDAAAPDD